MLVMSGCRRTANPWSVLEAIDVGVTRAARAGSSDKRLMKTLTLTLLAVFVLVSVFSAVQPPNCAAGEQYASATPVRATPFNEPGAPGTSDLPAEPAVAALASAGPRGLTNLSDLLLHAPSSAQRARVAEAIGMIAYHNPGAPELPVAVPALAAATESTAPHLRVSAIQGLGAIGKAASNTIPLLVRLTKDDDRGVRMCAVEALGRMGTATPQTVDALKLGLSDASGDVSFESLHALYRLGQPPSNTIPVLVRLTKDQSVGVRCAAVQGLGRLGANSPEVVAALQSALEDPSKDFVRPLAREALKGVAANPK